MFGVDLVQCFLCNPADTIHRHGCKHSLLSSGKHCLRNYLFCSSLRNKIRRIHLHFAATRKHFSLFVVLSHTGALIQKHHYCHSERAGCSGAYSVTCIIALPLYYSSSLQWRPISNTSLEAYRKPQPTPEELQKPVSVRSETNPCVWPQTMAGQGGVGLGDKWGYFGMSQDGKRWGRRRRYFSLSMCRKLKF